MRNPLLCIVGASTEYWYYYLFIVGAITELKTLPGQGTTAYTLGIQMGTDGVLLYLCHVVVLVICVLMFPLLPNQVDAYNFLSRQRLGHTCSSRGPAIGVYMFDNNTLFCV